MNLADYGIFTYRQGPRARYFIEGVHGNFHLGNTNLINDDVHQFIKAKGGIMKVMNGREKSENAEHVFSTYGCKEVLCGLKQADSTHPFESWEVDYYHPQFEVIRTEEATFIVYFRKKEAFLFLDDQITFDHNEWLCEKSFTGLIELFAQKKLLGAISTVFAFSSLSGNVFHQVTEGILRRKLTDLDRHGP